MKIKVDHFCPTKNGQRLYIYERSDDTGKFVGFVCDIEYAKWERDGILYKGSESSGDVIFPGKLEVGRFFKTRDERLALVVNYDRVCSTYDGIIVNDVRNYSWGGVNV